MTLPFLATATANPAAQIRAWWTSSVAWVDTHWLQIGVAVAAGLLGKSMAPFIVHPGVRGDTDAHPQHVHSHATSAAGQRDSDDDGNDAIRRCTHRRTA